MWVPPHENIFPEARAGCKAASALPLIEHSISWFIISPEEKDNRIGDGKRVPV